ncbi:ab6efe43-eaaf-4ea8-b5ba-8fb2bd44f1b0-CDS [Sclerotinia trifoliorum]|uniref:Ab6efe43-eaaf-4ea8-b5ba-8fb2bd44f1b0-CDS n=1 Tax=Sclerotinia trifoliorum TaxID=28548 RepID=A0A8H2VXB7_9HELO|nr:ab6efe43-eaaf-4ea8-b5ba-8fb2bd44f1b0-CDS [Sclerotinia trifoliorum]
MGNSQSTAQYRSLIEEVDPVPSRFRKQQPFIMITAHETPEFHFIQDYMNSENFLEKAPCATNHEYTPELFKHLQDNFPTFTDTKIERFVRATNMFRPGGYEIQKSDTLECLLNQASSFRRNGRKRPLALSDLIRRPAASNALKREMKKIINVNSGQPDDFRLADFIHFNYEECLVKHPYDWLNAQRSLNSEFGSYITTVEYGQYIMPLI